MPTTWPSSWRPSIRRRRADRVAEGPPAAFVALPDRAVLSVTGAPRLKFLHNILSNDVEGLKPGRGRRAALMDVKGHLLASVRILADADAAPGPLRARVPDELPTGDLDALRVEAGRPWSGPDVTEENLLHETGLLREYHSPTKGCYVGQEVVARLDARGGHVNKLMRGLRLTSPAAAGSTVTAEGKDVGRVTTAAVSSRPGPLALPYLHPSRPETG